MAEKDQNPNLRRLCNRPVCIICGRPAEAETIAKALGIYENRIHGHDIQKVKDGYTFYLGAFKLPSGGELEYYVTSSLRQGVCAGYNDLTGKLKLKLRDVVFGEAAINYEEGKFEIVEGKGVLFRPDYNRVTCVSGDMQAFAEDRTRPMYHYGEYISGSAVREDAGAVFEKIRNDVQRNAIALDMEASAFIQLCEHFGDNTTCLGVVKGVSDFGNSEKARDKGVYVDALTNAAVALREWITHQIPAITWEVDESLEPGARVVPGYYDNFVRRVLDNYCQGWPVTYKDEPTSIIPHEEIKGFKTVLPKGRHPSFVKELGPIRTITERYGIREINIGGKQGGRYLYYKAGYFMDWSRCVNILEEYEDCVYQVEVFERLLSKLPYYLASDEGPALASVVSWEDTVAWLKEIDDREKEALSARAIKERNQEGTNGQIKKAQAPPLETESVQNKMSHLHDKKDKDEQHGTTTRHTFSVLPSEEEPSPIREKPKNQTDNLMDVKKKKKSFSHLFERVFHGASREELAPPLTITSKKQ